jgi:DNA (cytosine-5)-methyltransferase 1
MRVLSLFSGGGLGDYGLTLAGMEIVGQVEIDEYCQKILKLRWPDVPKWRDIRDVKGSEVLEKCGTIDLISGGFPCQDISVANTSGKGIEGERSGLWSEFFRIICEIRPKYVLVENSSNLLSRGLGRVIGNLAEVGFDAEWHCIPASYFGANHIRDRIWIVGYTNGMREPQQERGKQDKWGRSVNASKEKDMAHAECLGWTPWAYEPCGNGYWRTYGKSNNGGEAFDRFRDYWAVEPGVGRMAHGVTNRVEQLTLLGNGQDIRPILWIGKRIMEFDKQS